MSIFPKKLRMAFEADDVSLVQQVTEEYDIQRALSSVIKYKSNNVARHYIVILADRVDINKCLSDALEWKNWGIARYIIDKCDLSVLSQSEITSAACKINDINTLGLFLRKLIHNNVKIAYHDILQCIGRRNDKLFEYTVELAKTIVDGKFIERLREERKRIKLEYETEDWVRRWISNSKSLNKYNDLPMDIERNLRKSVGSEMYTLYRGLTWSTKNSKLKDWEVSSDRIKEHNFFRINLSALSSWTTKLSVAATFATHDLLSDGSDIGIILKANIPSSKVIADLVNRDKEDDEAGSDVEESTLQSLTRDEETSLFEGDANIDYLYEVIVKPGEYKTEIIKVFKYENMYRESNIDLT